MTISAGTSYTALGLRAVLLVFGQQRYRVGCLLTGVLTPSVNLKSTLFCKLNLPCLPQFIYW